MAILRKVMVRIEFVMNVIFFSINVQYVLPLDQKQKELLKEYRKLRTSQFF
jgi:hypothetical protein